MIYFQLILIAVLETEKSLSATEKLEKYTQLFLLLKKISDYAQFTYDLTMLTNALHSKNKQAKAPDLTGYTIADTDHFWTMLMIGTDVDGSCQRVDGPPSLNKCLIGGYVLSGHVRAIVIRDADGHTVARAMFKMMLDEQTKNPVLFLEEVYPGVASEEFSNAIKQFAIARAMAMSCPLLAVAANTANAKDCYPNPITTLNVKGVEYVDALHSPQTAGYTIPAAEVLFDPLRYQQQLSLIATRRAFCFRENNQSMLLYLRQAWDAGIVKEITWLQQEQGEVKPVAVVFSNGKCLEFSDSNKKVVVCSQKKSFHYSQ